MLENVPPVYGVIYLFIHLFILNLFLNKGL